MNIKAINSAIIDGNFSNDQLSSIIEAVKFARSQLGREIKRSLQVGDNVNFTDKTGRTVTGHVTKVAVKYVTVRTVQGLWRVPANMLTRVADEREFVA